jgi:hypothetical protein
MYSDAKVQKYNTIAVVWSALNFILVMYFEQGMIMAALAGLLLGWTLATSYTSYNIDSIMKKTFSRRHKEAFEQIKKELNAEINDEVERRLAVREAAELKCGGGTGVAHS